VGGYVGRVEGLFGRVYCFVMKWTHKIDKKFAYLISALLLAISPNAIAETSPSTLSLNYKDLRHETLLTVSDWITSKKGALPPEWLVDEDGVWKPPLNKLNVGLHIESLHRLNHEDQTFGFIGTIWSKWSGELVGWDKRDLGNPADYWFFNSIDSYDFDRITYTPYEADGWYSVDLTVDGRLRSKLDYKKYPFDNQKLNIEMELGLDGYEALIFAETNPTVFADFNRILDYEVERITTENLVKVHPTDYGVPDYEPGETFANGFIRTTIHLKRIYLNSFFDYVLPLLTVTGLLLINASRISTDKGVKLSLPPAALLAIIFMQQFTDQQIPNLSYLTFLDLLYLCAYSLVFVCFFEAAICRYEDDMNESERDLFVKGRAISKRVMWGIFLTGPICSWVYVSYH